MSSLWKQWFNSKFVVIYLHYYINTTYFTCTSMTKIIQFVILSSVFGFFGGCPTKACTHYRWSVMAWRVIDRMVGCAGMSHLTPWVVDHMTIGFNQWLCEGRMNIFLYFAVGDRFESGLIGVSGLWRWLVGIPIWLLHRMLLVKSLFFSRIARANGGARSRRLVTEVVRCVINYYTQIKQHAAIQLRYCHGKMGVPCWCCILQMRSIERNVG